MRWAGHRARSKPEIAWATLLAGTPLDAVTHIRKLQAEGHIDYCVGAFAWGDLQHAEVMSSLALFVSEVMPHFAH